MIAPADLRTRRARSGDRPLPSRAGRDTRHRWARIVPLAFCYAALIYTHNVYALISSPVLGLYLALLWWRAGRRWRRKKADALNVPIRDAKFFCNNFFDFFIDNH